MALVLTPPRTAAVSGLPRVLLAGTFLSKRQGSRCPIEDLAEKLAQADVKLLCASSFRWALPRVAHLLATAAVKGRSYDVAVVDLYSGRAFSWGAALSYLLKALGRPFVLVLHGGGLPEYAAKHPGRVRACLARAAAVAAPSAYLRERLHPYRDDIILLPNPLELGHFEFRLRRQVRPRLLWIRAFQRVYNPALAVHAAARVAGEFPELQLTMVGRDKDGSLPRTRETAAKLGMAGRIALPGGAPHREVRAWFAQGDIFLNTSDEDNAPVSVMEAMACGLCVVSTDAGGIPYLLEHERDALIVPRNDPDAMAAAVRRLLREPALGPRLSANARRKAERFDWKAVFPQWLTLLTSLMRKENAGDS